MPKFIFQLLVFVLLLTFVYAASPYEGLHSVHYGADSNSLEAQSGMGYVSIAWGEYSDTMNQTGWGNLWIATNGSFSDQEQAFSAGFLEGMMTHERIYQTFQVFKHNTLDDFKSSGPEWPKVLLDYITANIDYLNSQVQALSATDDYWYQTGLVLYQLTGLVEGYARGQKDPKAALTLVDLWILNSMGDMDDLTVFLIPSRREEFATVEWHETHHHCTGLIKLLPDFSDLYVGHDTWGSLNTMNRISKQYKFAFSASRGAVSQNVIFSSYPGVMFSNDDFYVLDTKLAVIETTNHVWNMTLYDEYCTPKSSLAWTRALVSNRMSTTGAEWVKSFARENSGTYNNQWVVVDYKLFVPRVKPTFGLITIVEQIPGLCMNADRTEQLVKDLFFASINAPTFKYIYDISGYPEMVAKQGIYWSYKDNIRMKIMQRDTPDIVTHDDFGHFLRYNHYKTDPLSNGDPGEQICARYDLRSKEGFGVHPRVIFGCMDTKTTSVEFTNKMKFRAIGSPTYRDYIPAFNFATCGIPTYHVGLPDLYEFTWLEFEALL